MLSKPNKATTNSIKSAATVPVNPQDQAKSAVKFLCRKGLQGHESCTENPACRCLPVKRRDRCSVGLHLSFQNAIKNPGPCLKDLSERNCSEEIMTLTEPRGEVSGDQADAHREQLFVTEDPRSCRTLLMLLFSGHHLVAIYLQMPSQ